jgi:hypothetical protein
MKIFTYCQNNFCGRKFYLNTIARTRNDLYNTFGNEVNVTCPLCHCNTNYDVHRFSAEVSDAGGHLKNSGIGVLIGGLLGIIAGPAGILFGALGGGSIGGGASYKTEIDAVNRFNNSTTLK